MDIFDVLNHSGFYISKGFVDCWIGQISTNATLVGQFAHFGSYKTQSKFRWICNAKNKKKLNSKKKKKQVKKELVHHQKNPFGTNKNEKRFFIF